MPISTTWHSLAWRPTLSAFVAAMLWAWPTAAAQTSRAAAGPATVAILSGSHPAHERAAEALKAALQRQGRRCVLLQLPKANDNPGREKVMEQLVQAKPVVIASAGASATSRALAALPKTPVVFFMVPNALDAPVMAEDNPDRTRVAGVAADISPKDRIARVRRLHPGGKHVAVLYSDRTRRTLAALEHAAKDRGITISGIEADKNEFPKAIEALNRKRPDSVLMIPDAKVYNAATVRRLLLWGIRQKKPIWAFSSKITEAGALAGQSIDSEAVGRQAAELVRKVIDGTSASKLGLQYPQRVDRAVNERTAELIGVKITDQQIGAKTQRFGERP